MEEGSPEINESALTIPGGCGGTIRPWVKGQSGNPKGRPPGIRNRSTIYREWLECKATDQADGDKSDQIARSLIEKACKGDIEAAREIFDSAFGKLAEIHEVSTKVHPADIPEEQATKAYEELAKGE
jgi:uncharacterized protein DUF5681